MYDILVVILVWYVVLSSIAGGYLAFLIVKYFEDPCNSNFASSKNPFKKYAEFVCSEVDIYERASIEQYPAIYIFNMMIFGLLTAWFFILAYSAGKIFAVIYIACYFLWFRIIYVYEYIEDFSYWFFWKIVRFLKGSRC